MSEPANEWHLRLEPGSSMAIAGWPLSARCCRFQLLVVSAFVREHIGLPERDNDLMGKLGDTFAIIVNLGEKRGGIGANPAGRLQRSDNLEPLSLKRVPGRTMVSAIIRGDAPYESIGLRCAQGQACSNAAATRSKVASAPTGATSWMASGTPALSKPVGKLTAGLPVRLNGIV
jgi:hypothetical protein